MMKSWCDTTNVFLFLFHCVIFVTPIHTVFLCLVSCCVFIWLCSLSESMEIKINQSINQPNTTNKPPVGGTIFSFHYMVPALPHQMYRDANSDKALIETFIMKFKKCDIDGTSINASLDASKGAVCYSNCNIVTFPIYLSSHTDIYQVLCTGMTIDVSSFLFKLICHIMVHNIPNWMKEVTWLKLCLSTNGHRSAALEWLPFILLPVFVQAAAIRSW